MTDRQIKLTFFGRAAMRIGELAARTGHTAETIRFYEKSGLLPPPQRLANNYRTYGDEHVSRLEFIRRCRTLDISLEEIRVLLESIAEASPAGADRAHQMIHRHLEAVEARMQELLLLKTSLTDLAASCAGHHDADHTCALLEKLRGQQV